MKYIIHNRICIALIVFSTVFCPSAFSQGYRDNFDVLKEDNWEPWGEFSIWKAENGFLKGWIQTPHLTFELLQFKDSSGLYENFDISAGINPIQRQARNPGYENATIIVKNIGNKNSGRIGIALGIPGRIPLFYLFLMERVHTARFNGLGTVMIGDKLTRKPFVPKTSWDTQVLKSMEIRFNRGHFQWFANGEKRADFEDPDFPSIEILGFVFIGEVVRVGHAWVDSFTISGAGLSVSPQAKLATRWGEFKKQQ
ncbi:MAG: hypothetical protein OXI43_19625 [Candidatus Poribacteria bacterium]|nr:hypothetical protein [Candidatus Poribacteria bacterium]